MANHNADPPREFLHFLKDELDKLVKKCLTVEDLKSDIHNLVEMIKKNLDFNHPKKDTSKKKKKKKKKSTFEAKERAPVVKDEFDEDTIDLCDYSDPDRNEVVDLRTDFAKAGLQANKEADNEHLVTNTEESGDTDKPIDYSNFSGLIKNEKDDDFNTNQDMVVIVKQEVADDTDANYDDHSGDIASEDDEEGDGKAMMETEDGRETEPACISDMVDNALKSGSDGISNMLRKSQGKRKRYETGEKICQQCGKTLQNRKALLQHMTIHAGEKPHKCPLCDRRYTRRDSIPRHIESFHLKKLDTSQKNNPLKCIDCYKTFDTLEGKTEHDCPVIATRPFVCHYCGKHFSMTDKLRDHVVSQHLSYKINGDGEIETSYNNADLVWYIRQLLRCKKCNLIFQTPRHRRAHLRKGICNGDFKGPVRDNQLKERDTVSEGKGESTKADSPEESVDSDHVTGDVCREDSDVESSGEENSNQKVKAATGTPLCVEDLAVPEKDGSYVEQRYESNSSTAIYTTTSRSVKKVDRLKKVDLSLQEDDSNNIERIEFLNELFRRSTKVKIYKCKFCHANFTSMFALERHERAEHTGEKPYLCDICAKGFYTKPSLKCHMKKFHSDSPVIECEICGKGFYCEKALQRHISGHTGRGPCVCETCGRGFADKSDLKRHVKRHDAVKDVVCEICGKAFHEKSSYRSHIQWAHTEERSECEICGFVSKNRNGLKKHIKWVHVLKSSISCEVCGKLFKTQSYLRNHMISHKNERPYKCSYCPKTFARPGAVNIHERIHTGVKPYSCEICGKKSTDIANHIKHKKIHVNDFEKGNKVNADNWMQSS